MNLAALLHRSAQALGEHPALAQGAAVVASYRTLARRAAALASGLSDKLGLAPGARVALVMANHPDYVTLLFACWQAGLTAVPVNAKLHERELAFILEHSGASACFVTPKLAAVVGRAAGGLPDLSRVIETGSAEWQTLLQADALPLAETAPDDVAWLFYTSGTTGRPKGAMLTHRNLLAMALSYLADVDSVAPGDALLHAAPMSHGSGLYILPFLAQGATQVVPESAGFDPAEILELVAHRPGLCFFAAPTMVKRLVEHPACGTSDTRNLKTITYGGGPMYLADIRRAQEVLGYRFAQIYGQGESPMCITALNKAQHAALEHPRYEARLASVGYRQSVVEVRVADAEGRSLPPGEVGEVLVRGLSVMRGYWQNEVATQETLKDGWLHTGDLGSLDEDGFLTLSDRAKDLIISGGSNIYPREVEEVLLLHPGVAEVSIVGRPHADWGEEVVAVLVAKPGTAVPVEELERLCLEHIARFKRPRHYRFVEALPKNNYGKVLKTELRTQLATVNERKAS